MATDIELLAPAGSAESLRAAVNAGADAVYMGSTRFGARAYADNPEPDSFSEAMDYAHLHGRKVYLTVNTLIKEKETADLYAYLKPFYERGIDAVIVQDYGALLLIREWFPDLPVHASTQMSVTGKYHAARLKDMGVSRIILARELSIPEIRDIAGSVDIELECFIHGAMCYCYSGQCLLSSLIGGRSGNRGRCAQPCRLSYIAGSEREAYLLNMKDLGTLEILPDIIEAGVSSFKIEGRMKSPRYTAGVVSIYRKYLDLFMEKGREGYRTDPEDIISLSRLYDRGGSTQGYFFEHNGKDMIALSARPDLRETDQSYLSSLDDEYVTPISKIPVCGRIEVHEGEETSFTIYDPVDKDRKVSVKGPVAASAKTQPLSAGQVKAQAEKTGNSIYYFKDLFVDLKGSCFLAVRELNELRRAALKAYKEQSLDKYRRPYASDNGKDEKEGYGLLSEGSQTAESTFSPADHKSFRIHVSIEDIDSLDVVLSFKEVDEVCLDSCTMDESCWKDAAARIHSSGKKCALILPSVFRKEAKERFSRHIGELKMADFDELIIRSLEEPDFLKEYGIDLPLVFDSNIYTWNKAAAEYLSTLGASRLTLPVELNRHELEDLGCEDKELIIYGHLPVMVTAQCLKRTIGSCDKKPSSIYMKDRTGRRFPVKNICRFCFNTIYNPVPLSLLGEEEAIERLSPAVLRLSFTTESPERIKEILNAYVRTFCHGEKAEVPFKEYTRGHFNRGVG